MYERDVRTLSFHLLGVFNFHLTESQQPKDAGGGFSEQRYPRHCRDRR